MNCTHIPSLTDTLNTYKVEGHDSGNHIVIGWKCQKCNLLILKCDPPTIKEREEDEEKWK